MKYSYIKKPVITEKSLQLAQNENVYVFEVDPKANKNQIKSAIEDMLSVHVVDVHTVKRPAQTKKTGRKRMISNIPAKKKAYVKLEKGQTIEAFDVMKS